MRITVPPAPGITDLYRCDASGTPAPDGAWAKAVLTCAVTSLGGRNTAACVLRYRVRGTDGWTEKSVTAPGEAVFPADTGSDYQVRLTAADSFVSVSGDILPLPAAFALLDFDRKNKAAGIGQRAGTAGTLSVGMPIKMGTNRITDMGAPQDSADAATKGYVDGRKLTFFGIQVSASAFSEDETYADYGFRAAAALDGVLRSMVPEVIFGPAEAASGNFCPVSETFDGGVYIYAASVPEGDVTIPTILCWR